MRVFYFLSLSLFSLMTVSGCATRLDDVDDKILDVQQRIARVEQKSGMPIGSDRELLDGQRLADMRTQVAAIRNEVTVLSGKVEALEFENKNLNEQMKGLMTKLDARDREIRQLKQAPAPAAGEELKGPEGDYNEALKHYQDGDFEKAEKGFLAFVARNPRNELADNALFWLGEGYMARKMHRNAITKFQDLIEKYPKSDMRCEAMKNQITCLKELGMEKEAAAFVKVRGAECPNK